MKFIAAFEGNGARPSHQGPGFSVEDVSYTLNTTEVHGAAYLHSTRKVRDETMDKMNTELQQDNKVYDTSDVTYVVRRLTPTECARLQGFPDDWARNIAIENPAEEDLVTWRQHFEVFDMATKGSVKKRSDKVIGKFLKNPNTDSAEYKLWGNGIALPCIIPMMKAMRDVLVEEGMPE